MPKIHKTTSKSRSFRRKTRSRAKRGGMMRGTATLSPLTFHAMDATAAATTNPNALEAIRLTKLIMNEYTDVSFHAEEGIYYLDVSVGGHMAQHIWSLVNAMKEIPQIPMGAIARNRDDMVKSSACSYVVPLYHQFPPSMSEMQRIELLKGTNAALMMRQLMTQYPGMDAKTATKMTTCMTNHHASELTRPPPIVRNALETIGPEQPDVVVSNMMFQVEMNAAKCPFENGHPMNQDEFDEFYEAYTGMSRRAPHPEKVRVALQKLCDTLMPADVVVAIAKNMQNEAMARALHHDSYEA